MGMSVLMGYREYARYRGCSLGAVQKAITSGRISAAVVDGKIDRDEADRLWKLWTDQSQQRGDKAAAAVVAPETLPILDGVVEQAPAALSRRMEWPEPWPPLSEQTSGVAPAATDKRSSVIVDGERFQRAKVAREEAEAEMAQLKLAQAKKLVLDTVAAVKMFAALGKLHAQGRVRVPADVSYRLVGLTDVKEIERLIRAAMADEDRRCANEVRARFAEITSDAAAS